MTRSHKLSRPHPIEWFHDWEDRILVENWIPVRFQPILFAFLFIGIIFVVIYRPNLPSITAMAGSFTAYLWLILALVCPPILFIAWIMIHWGAGRKTYVGYWMRFAADAGQTFSYAAFLITITADPTPELEDAYGQILLASILAFLIIIVVRDVLKLVLLERTSKAVQKAQDQQDFNEAVEAADRQAILDARDASHIEDVQKGIETTRQKVERQQLHLDDLTTGLAREVSRNDAFEARVDEGEARADKSEARETDWSMHKDHQSENAEEHEALHNGNDDAGP